MDIYICKYSSDLCTLLYVYYTKGGIQQTIITIFRGWVRGVYTHIVHTHTVYVYMGVCIHAYVYNLKIFLHFTVNIKKM